MAKHDPKKSSEGVDKSKSDNQVDHSKLKTDKSADNHKKSKFDLNCLDLSNIETDTG